MPSALSSVRLLLELLLLLLQSTCLYNLSLLPSVMTACLAESCAPISAASLPLLLQTGSMLPDIEPVSAHTMQVPHTTPSRDRHSPCSLHSGSNNPGVPLSPDPPGRLLDSTAALPAVPATCGQRGLGMDDRTHGSDNLHRVPGCAAAVHISCALPPRTVRQPHVVSLRMLLCCAPCIGVGFFLCACPPGGLL